MRQGPTGPPHYSPPFQHVGLFQQTDAARRDAATMLPASTSRPAAAAGVSIAQHGGAGGSPARLPSENTGYSNAVKISHNSKVPPVAGKIAHSLRNRDLPTLLVAGNSSIYTAIKCCITAARFVQAEGLSVEFEPLFRDHDHSRALLALCVLPSSPHSASAAPTASSSSSPVIPRAAPPLGLPSRLAIPGASSSSPAAPFEIKISVHSRHAKVGAALSAYLADRGASARAVLLAVGETASASAVMAAAHAAHYLAAQRTGLRLAVQVQAVTVVRGADQLSGVRLWVRLQRPEETAELPAMAAGASSSAAAAAAASAASAAAVDLASLSLM